MENLLKQENIKLYQHNQHTNMCTCIHMHANLQHGNSLTFFPHTHTCPPPNTHTHRIIVTHTQSNTHTCTHTHSLCLSLPLSLTHTSFILGRTEQDTSKGIKKTAPNQFLCCHHHQQWTRGVQCRQQPQPPSSGCCPAAS